VTDRFNEKARELLEDGETSRIEDVLREYAQYVCIDCGKEGDDPGRYVEELNLKGGVGSLTEFQVAKGMLRERVRQNA